MGLVSFGRDPFSTMKSINLILVSLLLFEVILPVANATTEQEDPSCRNDDIDQRPRIFSKGGMETLSEDLFSTSAAGDNIWTASVSGGESVGLTYVKSFLSADEVSQAIGFCDGRDGWTSSRQNKDGSGNSVGAARTSNSCPLIWPLLYLPKLEQIRQSGRLTKSLEDEIHFAWKLMQRIADFLEVDVARVEPLQLVRYNPGQFYRQHHDHGSYYGASTEQRPMTFLIFLSTMPAADGGGHTKFSELDLAVLPLSGDGILWKNVDENGEILLDALHEAVPPETDGSVKKFAMNVWIADEPIMKNIDSAVYRTN